MLAVYTVRLSDKETVMSCRLAASGTDNIVIIYGCVFGSLLVIL